MTGKQTSLPPLKTWQFFHACRKTLGDTFLQKLYNRGIRQIYRWSADPDFTGNNERNPLDRFKILLERLAEIGREDIALSAIEMFADAIGYEVQKNGKTVVPDQETIEAECLDDYPALVDFHKAVQDGKGEPEVRHLWGVAKRELDETYFRFIHDGDD